MASEPNYNHLVKQTFIAMRGALEALKMKDLPLLTICARLQNDETQIDRFTKSPELFERLLVRLNELDLQKTESRSAFDAEMRDGKFTLGGFRNKNCWWVICFPVEHPDLTKYTPHPCFFMQCLIRSAFTACRIALWDSSQVEVGVGELIRSAIGEACKATLNELSGGYGSFVKKQVVPGGAYFTDSLLDMLQSLSYKPEEGRYLSGVTLLQASEVPEQSLLLELQNPVPLDNIKLARKTLDIAFQPKNPENTSAILLSYKLGGSVAIVGLAEMASTVLNSLSCFRIRFVHRGRWQLWHAEQKMLDVSDGSPVFSETVSHQLGAVSALGLEQHLQESLTELCEKILTQNKGAIVIVSSEAESEAKRLSERSSGIKPLSFSEALNVLPAMCGVDGAILLDRDTLTCYAFGVILDGTFAPGSGRSDRGSRYNSTAAYVQTHSTEADVFGLVFSADGGLDVVAFSSEAKKIATDNPDPRQGI